MFNFFKKKNKASINGAKANEVLRTSAEMLKMQLMLCTGNDAAYHRFLESNQLAGYSCGFFDATLQYTKMSPPEESSYFALLSIGFLHLFNMDQDKALAQSQKFFTHESNPEFHEARIIGGTDYLSLARGEIKMPSGLVRLFRGGV